MCVCVCVCGWLRASVCTCARAFTRMCVSEPACMIELACGVTCVPAWCSLHHAAWVARELFLLCCVLCCAVLCCALCAQLLCTPSVHTSKYTCLWPSLTGFLCFHCFPVSQSRGHLVSSFHLVWRYPWHLLGPGSCQPARSTQMSVVIKSCCVLHPPWYTAHFQPKAPPQHEQQMAHRIL